MISRLDADVGRLLDHLRQLALQTNTLVLFTSDNGPHKEGGQDPEFFHPNGPLKGYKRDLTDGGIRVPFIAWWPGHIRPGRVSTHVGYFGDFMATATELAGAAVPEALDSLSLVPTLLGRGRQQKHDLLYWEFHESGFSQAVLLDGRWKGIRLKRPDTPIQLYDLRHDIGETNNLADARPKLIKRVTAQMEAARSDSPLWPIRPAR
jgi:arylsulfatase A-like enzyme